MSRRNRGNLFRLALLLLLGAAVGVAGLSLLMRTQEPAPVFTRPDLAVEVLNGCGIDGAAGRVASELRRAGYRVERTGPADHYHYRQDVVVVRTGALGDGEAVARILGGAAVVEQRRADSPVAITVIVGTPHPLVPDR